MAWRKRDTETASTDTSAAETTVSGSTGTAKKKGIPKIALVLVLALVVIGGGFFGLRKFVFKPKAETVASTTTASSTPAGTATEAGAPTNASTPVTAVKPDDGSKTGTILRAGMRGCDVNRSHIFIVSFPGGEEKEVRLSGVDSFHYGPITQEADNRANALMRGKSVTVTAASEDFFRITGSATLADGRDMAEALALAGLVQQADGATDAVKKACDRAQSEKRGLYALLKS